MDSLKNLKFSLIKKEQIELTIFLKIINFIKQTKYNNFLEDLAGIQLFELLSRFAQKKNKSELLLWGNYTIHQKNPRKRRIY